ncbi:MAG: DUF1598 domain-containing protein [Rubripirellula sp.]
MPLNLLRSRFGFIALGIALIGGPAAVAEEVESHLAAGEFAAARQMVDQLPAVDRDPVLAQIAGAQGTSGESVAAGGTIREINSPASRDTAVSEAAGAGGGSFADFQSLMDLVQTTVVPDTWEALGGPSTMAPYPQGVYVDAAGTVLECETVASSNAVEDLKSLLSDPQPMTGKPIAWRNAANLRCVSLRRLLDQWTQHRLRGIAASNSMMHMAGLSRVQYLFIDGNDIVIAGPVGGIDVRDGWHVDRKSGLTTFRFDFFLTCLASALGNQPFGCTIDPTTEGLQNAAKVAAAVQSDRIPIGKADEAMVAALGMQNVEVFGTAGDTPIGYVMVEADRHMKQLALGLEPMPRNAFNYLDVIEDTIAQGPPDQLLLRLWFTSAPRPVRADSDRKVFELAGTPIRLSGENERAMASGQRGNITRDARSETFVAGFNQNWHAIRTEYPIYGALESVYRTASVAELLRRFSESPQQQLLLQSLLSHNPSSNYLMATPRQVESIATLHSIRKGRKVHHIILASGGVAVNSRQTLTSQIADYPSLANMEKPGKTRPAVVQRWWWDVER